MRYPIPEAALSYIHTDYLDGSANVNLTDPSRVRLDLTTVADERDLADIRPILAPLLEELARDPSSLVPYPMSDRFLQKRMGRLVLDTFGGGDVPEECVFFGAGTYPLWKELAAFLLRKGTLIGAAPLYPEFPGWFQALGGKYRGVTAPDWSFPLEQVLEALKEEEDPVAVLLDYPGNASGMCPTGEELETLLEAAAGRNVLVVVDEAYANFLEPRRSVIGAVAKRENLVVIRSLSKAWDLRGIRFGFSVYPKALAERVREIHSPFEPGTFAVAAAEHVLLSAPDFTAPLREAVTAAKKKVMDLLRSHGVRILPTIPEVPNLVMTLEGGDLFGRLRDLGVKVASGSRFRTTTPGMDDRFCRIRVPLAPERIQSLDQVFSAL